MTLLNGLLALGALTFTVPLAIHLLFRSRFTTLDWGAMYLLESVIRINRRRLQLMNLLLLLLRCLIPIALAFCLARPVLTGFQDLPGDAPQTLVIAIDDSRSMSARDESGQTRMERAKNDLRDLVGGLSRRDEVILLRSSQVDRPAASMGAQDALRKISQWTSLSGPLELDRLVRAALEASENASHLQCRVIVVSDFQAENVSDASVESLARLSKPLAGQPGRPVISFLNYGVDSEKLANVSVDSLAIESPAVVAGRGARFSARIRNSGERVAQDLRLVWTVDGQAMPTRTITIPPKSTSTNMLSHGIEEPGVHHIALAVEHADAISDDNRRNLGVAVTDEIRVMLLDGRPSSRPLEGETDFLSIALSPFAFGGEDLPDAVRADVVNTRTFADRFAESRPDVLILANVKDMQESDRSTVAGFVLNGGALVVFDGDAVDPETYNEGWQSEDGPMTFPATMGDVIGNASGDRPEKAIAIGALNPQYTAWSLLESKDDRPLNKVEVYRYRKLIPNASDDANSEPNSGEPNSGEQVATTQVDAPSPTSESPERQTRSARQTPAITLLRMNGGDPLVVSARRGRGRIVQFAVPCDSDWTTLPMRMVYLPMMQQLMLDLAGRRVATTVDVGDSLAVPIDEFDRTTATENDIEQEPGGEKKTGDQQVSEATWYTIQVPQGEANEIQPTEESSPQLLLDDTDTPGVYRFRRSRRVGKAEPTSADTIRVVEVPPEESRLRDVNPARLSMIAESIDANIYTSVQNLKSDDRVRRYGREIWRWLLIALLIGMVGELFLQQRLTGRSVRRGAA